VKFSQITQDRLRRNKVLVILTITFFLTSALGYYYNLIKDFKTIFHYSFKPTADRSERIFFNRSSEFDENKEIREELFRYDPETIVNIYNEKAYFISNQSGFHQIFSFNFVERDIELVFENSEKINVYDLFLTQNKLFILSTNKVIEVNLLSSTLKELAFQTEIFKQFVNIDNNSIILSEINCSLRAKDCYKEFPPQLLVYNLTTQEISKIAQEESISKILEIKPYIGVNKIYRLGKLNYYKNEKEIKNYNLRFFTQL
jgi:hypothetical protein